MTALTIALACLMAAPEDGEVRKVTEEESLSILLAKKARWDGGTKTLTITGAGDFGRQDLRTLRNLSSVKTLHIAYTLEDDDLATLRESTQLETVVLTGDHFTDKAIPHLAVMRWLKTLKLENCSLTAIGITSLSKMNALESLSLIQVCVPEQAMAGLKSVPSLRELTMRKTSSVKGLSGCRQLRVLALKRVDGTILSTDQIVAELGGLQQLESLTVSITEKTVFPSAAESWFAFGNGSFVATSDYPLCNRLMTALPKTDVSIKLENKTVIFKGPSGTTTLRVN